MFYLDGFWLWLLVPILLLDIGYFSLLFLKKKDNKIFIFLIHSLFFLTTGFAYLLILGNNLFINLFLIVWSLIYLLYLESILHYFYQTRKVILIDLKNVIAYVNLVTLFFAISFLINLYIFINISWWLVLLVSFALSFILLLTRLEVNGVKLFQSLLYSSVVSLIIVEMVAVVLYFTTSFYASSVMLSLFYYLLSSFSLLNIKKELTKGVIIQYSIFTVVVLALIALTSQWL
jgi:hypothetical protein